MLAIVLNVIVKVLLTTNKQIKHIVDSNKNKKNKLIFYKFRRQNEFVCNC